ncbi:MAG TPA: ATP-binding protein [Syntrophorhabdaceae bacterium]|nr:ATP-binding protein [Syntrophorhabdaceae bacterium]
MTDTKRSEEWSMVELDRLRKEVSDLRKALSELREKYEGAGGGGGLAFISREAQAEILKMKNLESIGTLAGGIAHDFNNLLMAVTGYIALAKTRIGPQNMVYELLSEAERISFMGKELTQQLITFSKGGEPAKKIINLNALVKEALENALAGSGITARFSISDSLNRVEADEGQIRQVINNIAVNSREAMPRGGTLKVSIDRALIGEDGSIPLESGNYVRISFEDEGCGMTEDVLPRIFDPYFTTKVMGSQKGMGLGLAVVYSIARKHNGTVTAESVPGKGTTVHVYLPLLVPAKVRRAPEAPQRVSPKGKILFMDDEKIIRDIAQQIISRLGYEAVLAENGLEAIDLYIKEQQSGGRFEVVILDLTVKRGAGGKEAMTELLRIDPEVKAIISSGYTNDSAIARYSDFGFVGAITKPYKANDLKELIERVVETKT